MSEKVNIKDVLDTYLPSINKTLEYWLPREWSSRELREITGMQRYAIDVDSLNKTTTQPMWDLLDRGGKRWRSTLLILIAEAFGKKVEDVIDFVVITEVVHNGSLIVDDIEDDSEFRRGKPCLHKITGVDVAVNAGNLMYFLPLRILRERKDGLSDKVQLELYEVYSKEMLNLHIGQALDICWHSSIMSMTTKEPSVDNYLHMCGNKTGGLARMSAKMSAIISGASPDQVEAIGRFAESVGIAFQIQDDILNIEESAALAQNKGGAGEDIHEGKRTIMVIHCFNTAPSADAKRLKEILAMKTNDVTLINEAIQIMKRNGSIEFAKAKAKELMLEAWSELDSFLEASSAKSKLRALVDYLIERDS